MTPGNRNWDFGRFIEVLRFFDVVPIISWWQTMISGAQGATPPQPQGGVLFDFTQPPRQALALWGALDDVVMGGVSQSQAVAGDHYLRFTGLVSTDKGGGFASIRTRNFQPSLNLAAAQGLCLRVRGDGQRYKFFLRDQPGWDAIAYGYSFDTVADTWVTITIPFAQLTPLFRAKSKPQAPPLTAATICSLQLMLSKFEYDQKLNPHFRPGPFALDVEKITLLAWGSSQAVTGL